MSRREPGADETSRAVPPAAAASQPKATTATADDRCREAEALLAQGAPLPAYDVAAEGLAATPGHVRLRQLLALALARSGASRQASARLLELRREGHLDEETLGMLARTHKDLAAAASDPADRRRHLTEACRYYQEAFDASGGIWSGINVATTALLLGETNTASRVATQVRAMCLAAGADGADAERRAADYWRLATLGEASLVLGDVADAERWYVRARSAAGNRLGDRASTRRNARLLLHGLGHDPRQLDAAFDVPRVVVCVGHLIDRPGRVRPRFPPALEPAVRAAVRARLQAADAGIGFASAACGVDIIALECLADLGAETHVILPYRRDQFVPDSVDVVPGADWAARFDRVVARASSVTMASDQRMGHGAASFEYAFRLCDGGAGVRADELDTDLVCLAVWDGEAGDGSGGTAWAVDHWRRLGREIHVIDLTVLRRDHERTAGAADITTGPSTATPTTPTEPTADVAPTPGPASPATLDPRIVALLFADVEGFSQLSDTELPRFVEDYLGLVARELAGLPAAPLLTNTWGDGIYIVFADVRHAGAFALRLCEAVRTTDWTVHGLPSSLGLRIGLHAGPAYACLDPVTNRPNYFGAHVSRAARIEPVTPPGEVYASQPFAALARADGVTEFSCAYVGPMPMAKGYGTFPTYVVRPR